MNFYKDNVVYQTAVEKIKAINEKMERNSEELTDLRARVNAVNKTNPKDAEELKGQIGKKLHEKKDLENELKVQVAVKNHADPGREYERDNTMALHYSRERGGR
ncbi:MAG: hypothetical protein LBG12_11955 [Synergistaceae bacterium]|jgi:hypothetical protein|nr:hypothetical protein [Synergistaceae bacterium]